MASLTRWTWVWVNSGSWWWTGRPGMLRFMGSQSWTRLSNWTELIWSFSGGFLGASSGKEPAFQCRLNVRKMGFLLGLEDPMEKGMAIHSSILAWKIPWTDESGRLQLIGLHRFWHSWSELACIIQSYGDEPSPIWQLNPSAKLTFQCSLMAFYILRWFLTHLWGRSVI